MTPLLLSRTHYPVSNLGFGVRAGIWFQGCTVRCRGCVAVDTWAFDRARSCTVEDVLVWLDGLDGSVDGVTISGGEPTDQPRALRVLLDGIRTIRGSRWDILVYSGHEEAHLREHCEWLFAAADVVISEPFVAAEADDSPLRGSANQRIHLLTELARAHYAPEDLEARYGPQRRRMGVHADRESVWLVGIPQPGDLETLRARMADRGVRGRTSWLT